MTFRTTALLIAMVTAATPFALAADDDTQSLRAGRKLEGELMGPERGAPMGPGAFGGFGFRGYFTEIPVTLKAGQKITISGTVVGTNRSIAIALKDPTDKMIAATANGARSVKLVVEEVSATGKYKVLLASDLIGDFSVTADFLEIDDEKELEKDIARLKKELAEIEAKLKTLRDKKRG
jgi:hypothetical protein